MGGVAAQLDPATQNKQAKIDYVIRLLPEARLYVMEHLVAFLEKGLKQYDPSFSFTDDQRNRLQTLVQEILAPGGGRVMVTYDETATFAGECDVRMGRIDINAAKAGTNVLELLEGILTHEVMHYLSYTFGSPTELVTTRNAFWEGTTQFLTHISLRQDGSNGVFRDLNTYGLETFQIYALLKSGRVTPRALVAAFLGDGCLAEPESYPPEAAFLGELNRGLSFNLEDSLFPVDLTTFTLDGEDIEQYNAAMTRNFELLQSIGLDLDALADNARENFFALPNGAYPAILGSQIYIHEPGFDCEVVDTDVERGVVFVEVRQYFGADGRGQEQFGVLDSCEFSDELLVNLMKISANFKYAPVSTMTITKTGEGIDELYDVNLEYTMPSGTAKEVRVSLTRSQLAAIVAAAGRDICDFEAMGADEQQGVFGDGAGWLAAGARHNLYE
ncbi:Uncharacterised protein [Candidatus Burarchaeum australiense]|nr:Uncharacterised protein [Candidatus Burarchaeum australiense]